MKQYFLLDNTCVIAFVLILIFFVIVIFFQSLLINEKNNEIKREKIKNKSLREKLAITQEEFYRKTFKLPEVDDNG